MTATTSTRSRSTRDRKTRPVIPAAAPFWRRGMTYVYAAVALFAVGVLFFAFSSSREAATTAGEGFVVGNPGPGEQAPGFTLQASNGETVDLADYRGKNVLLYFQEGIGCQPCWDQMRDLEKASAQVQAAGVDEILSITTSPLDLVTRKVKDDGLSTVVASDPDLSVSKRYEANKYGMMGTSSDGHSFVLVDPEGKITWRADYGGAPKYTMYLPVEKLLADLKAGV